MLNNQRENTTMMPFAPPALLGMLGIFQTSQTSSQ
jgi:hypothetical protein